MTLKTFIEWYETCWKLMYNTRVIFSMIYMYLYKYLCYTGCAGAKMATGHYNERRFKSTSVVCH